MSTSRTPISISPGVRKVVARSQSLRRPGHESGRQETIEPWGFGTLDADTTQADKAAYTSRWGRMARSPLSRRCAFPFVESAEERIGILVAQQISGFVQFE